MFGIADMSDTSVPDAEVPLAPGRPLPREVAPERRRAAWPTVHGAVLGFSYNQSFFLNTTYSATDTTATSSVENQNPHSSPVPGKGTFMP
jgi:hypothetical protein